MEELEDVETAQQMLESIVDRLTNVHLENEVLSHIINVEEDQIELITNIKSDYFSKSENKSIFELVQQMFFDKNNISRISVENFINLKIANNNLNSIKEHYEKIINLRLSDTPFNSTCILREYLRNRKIYNDVLVEGNKMFTSGSSAEDIINHMSEILMSVETTHKEKNTEELADNVVDAILNGSPMDQGLETGIHDFDMQFGGIKKDRVYTIGSVSGGGKTAALVDFIERLSVRHKDKIKILFFSMEMSEERIMRRMISRKTKFTNQQLEGRLLTLNAQQKEIIKEAGKVIRGYPVEIVYRTMTTAQMKLRARKFALQNPDKHLIIMIDHLGLVSGKTNDMRVNTIDASATSKSFAVDYGASVIQLTQFTKEIDSNENKKNFHKPNMSYIMESGRVRQDSDVVLLYWRPEMYTDEMNYAGEENFETKNKMIVLVEKNRDGQAPNDIILGQNVGCNIIDNLNSF